MIEETVLKYLKSKGVRAFTEEPEDTKKEYVLIEKTGSSVENHVKRATLVIQSFSASLYSTAVLNEKVKEAMEQIIELDDVCKCKLNSDYNYPDITRKDIGIKQYMTLSTTRKEKCYGRCKKCKHR